jgi:hypothetical protein
MIEIKSTRYLLWYLRWNDRDDFAVALFVKIRFCEYPRAILGIERYLDYSCKMPVPVRVLYFFGKRLAKERWGKK